MSDVNPRRSLLGAPLLVAALALTGCGLGQQGSDSSGKVPVVASFYPLQFATQQIGGSRVTVNTLTKPGAEPHDVELTPQDVGTVSKARLVIFEKGLQGAVDSAVESQGGDRGLDVAPAARLDLRLATGTTDPHFWMDPQRYAAVGRAIATRLSSVDPANKAEYEKNAAAFEDRLDALSAEFTAGLATCRRKDIVTSHSAFSYLARRFGMKQIAINGISPEQEPQAAALAAVSRYVRANGVTTIYAETLVSPAIARTVASESGAKVATLDPLEGLTKTSAGKDYFEVMRSNLKALRAGQGCP
jgi:zinc transport system substrate-binding protein